MIKTVEAQLLQWSNDWDYHTQYVCCMRERWLKLILVSLRTAVKQGGGAYDYLLEYRTHIFQFYLNYAYLVVNSFGLQNAMEHSRVDIGHFFSRCHSSATTCANIVRDCLAPKGYLTSSPDSHFVLFSYAVLTLLKVCTSPYHLACHVLTFHVISLSERSSSPSWKTNKR